MNQSVVTSNLATKLGNKKSSHQLIAHLNAPAGWLAGGEG